MLGKRVCDETREYIQVFPQCIAKSYSTSQDQITFLFLCTENYCFNAEKKLPEHESLVEVET